MSRQRSVTAWRKVCARGEKASPGVVEREHEPLATHLVVPLALEHVDRLEAVVPGEPSAAASAGAQPAFGDQGPRPTLGPRGLT
jgi:hypothetical protein